MDLVALVMKQFRTTWGNAKVRRAHRPTPRRGDLVERLEPRWFLNGVGLTTEPNDTLGQALVVDLAAAPSGQLALTGTIGDNPALTGANAGSDVDVIRLNLLANHRYEFDIDAVTEGSQLDSVLELTDLNGDSLVRSDDTPAPGELADGNTDSFVRFAPTADGTYYLRVLSFANSFTGNYTLNLRDFGAGTRVGPQFAISVNGGAIGSGDTVNFGSVEQFESGPIRSFTILNTGDDILTFTSLTGLVTANPDLQGYSVLQPPTPTGLLPNDSTDFILQLNSGALGAATGAINVNATTLPTFAFNASGTVNPHPAGSEISVTLGAPTVVNGNTVYGAEYIAGVSSPINLFAAQVNPGNPSGGPSRVFTIRNRGDQTLNLSNLVVPTGFLVLPGNEPAATVAPGETTSLTVHLNIATTNIYNNAQLTFANNDANENPFTIVLNGNVAGTAIAQVSANGQTIAAGDLTPSTADFTDFGARELGVTVTRTFTVTNTGGSGTLNLSGSPGWATVTSGDVAAFTIVNPETSRILDPNGGSTTFQIRYQPTRGGRQSALITVTSNDAENGFYTFRVTGHGVDTAAITNLFDEQAYLARYADVRNAVQGGSWSSGLAHFLAFGLREKRSATPYFDEAFFLSRSTDVASAVGADKTWFSGFEHFASFGQREGRAANPFFSESLYRRLNPDVVPNITNGTWRSGFEHFVLEGQFNNRRFNLFYDDAFYLAQNPDVAAGVGAGTAFKSGLAHFIRFGQNEGRVFSKLFDEGAYRALYADVRDGVTNGLIGNGFLHFMLYGRNEGRRFAPLYVESHYLAKNADIAAAVTNNVLPSGRIHFLVLGINEPGRDFSPYYYEKFYLDNNPDVKAAVLAGTLPVGLEHYVLFGQFENRLAAPPA